MHLGVLVDGNEAAESGLKTPNGGAAKLGQRNHTVDNEVAIAGIDHHAARIRNLAPG